MLPSIGAMKPSEGVIKFIDFIKQRVGFNSAVIDIGAGKGRNSIYLAEERFEVFAVDFIQTAINSIDRLGYKNIHTHVFDLTEKWPFDNDFFDLAVDCFSSIDIDTSQGRINYRNELFRTLKNGGYALIMVVSNDDELESTFNHGAEKNSTIWPTGKFQKNYDENELKDFYKGFKILKLELQEKPAFKLGQNYTARNFWLVLQKNEKS